MCWATLSPSAPNLITGIADATLDRAPLGAIAGQAGLERVYKESHQYLDVMELLRPITKWNARVELAASLPEMVRKAFRLAAWKSPARPISRCGGCPLRWQRPPLRRTTYQLQSATTLAAD